MPAEPVYARVHLFGLLVYAGGVAIKSAAGLVRLLVKLELVSLRWEVWLWNIFGEVGLS